MLLSEREARSITEKLLSYVKADDASVGTSSEQLSHLRFADNGFLTSGLRENRAASVTVWIEGKRGSASTNDTDDASLRAAVEQAESIARIAPVDREYLPTLGRQTYKPVNAYVEATANISHAARAKQIADILAESERAKVVSAGFHQSRAVAFGFATKNGNFGFERTSVVGLSVTARTPDGTSSGYFARNHFDVARLDTARIAREAIRKAVEGRDARALEPGVYSVILEPQAVADLVGLLAFGFDARGAEEGRNAYSAPGGKTKIGEKLFDERLSVYSDPWNQELPGSQSAQAGLPAQRIYLVKNGVLETLVFSRFWAKQKTKEPTPGPVNFIVESSAPVATMEEMIRATERGLIVSRFWYIRQTDPRTASWTGLTRDGVWYVEGGKIRHAVKNFRFNQSVIGMLAPGNVEMIGASERVGGSDNAALLPALKLKQFNFTSQSEAV
ncbi:MAG TPA: metallopeptidase TldD-related protein [Pyrinomonadaceae bacterium]|nr:metallopeptidase TldD-related protein [Pyrinomonadaceae bacterium]